MLRILHISDTHMKHDYISIPEGIDMIIHSGDCSNIKDPFLNENEVREFLGWFSKQKPKYKILIAGNHDTSIENGFISKYEMADLGIIYLQHESVTIEGFNIFGSPYTPEFHNWAFNIPRDRLHDYWSEIPLNTDILITHGPPMHILDNDHNNLLGCKALYKKVRELPNLKIHQFGHIHNRISRNGETFINRGIFQEYNDAPKFINASFVDLMHKPQNGNIISEL